MKTLLKIMMIVFLLLGCTKESQIKEEPKPNCIECFKYNIINYYAPVEGYNIFPLVKTDTIKTLFSTLCDLSPVEISGIPTYENSFYRYLEIAITDTAINNINYEIVDKEFIIKVKCNLK